MPRVMFRPCQGIIYRCFTHVRRQDCATVNGESPKPGRCKVTQEKGVSIIGKSCSVARLLCVRERPDERTINRSAGVGSDVDDLGADDHVDIGRSGG